MNIHGISVGISSRDNFIFCNIKLVGKLTHSDYEKIVPMLQSSIDSIKEPTINTLIDAREFEGWELQAAWDDLKFGLKNLTKFDKMAFVGSKKWEEYAVKISNWFIPGVNLKYFEDINEALGWLSEESSDVNLSPLEIDIKNRKEDIKEDLKDLIQNHIEISGTNVAEMDEDMAKKLIIQILKEEIDKLS